MNTIKSSLIAAAFMLAFASCALKVNVQDARKTVEGLLSDLKNQNYSNLEKYFTDLSNESESQEAKEEKYRRLNDTTGPIRSYELVSSAESYDSDKGLNQLELKYKVVCARVTLIETFLVINDEGKEKIFFQNIENAPGP